MIEVHGLFVASVLVGHLRMKARGLVFCVVEL
jgi:hypothetical protein